MAERLLCKQEVPGSIPGLSTMSRKKIIEEDMCVICDTEFNLEDEGGINGYLGILYVAFCPTCFAGLEDMFKQLNDQE